MIWGLICFLYFVSQFHGHWFKHFHQEKLTEHLISPADQLALEGDSFAITCQINSHLSSFKLIWFKNGQAIDQYTDPNVYINLLIKSIDGQFGVISSSLFIIRLVSEYSGNWSCHAISSSRNLTQSFTLKVITNETKYCPEMVTSDNKGTYKWPITLSGTTRTLSCETSSSPLYLNLKASHYCSESGSWECLNLTSCPYLSQVTKVLEQFASINITKNYNNNFSTEIIRSLYNYIGNGSIIKDKMDVVFIANTISNVFASTSKSKQIIYFLIEIINSIMNVSPGLIIEANKEDRPSTIFLSSLIKSSSLIPETEVNRFILNLAIEEIVTTFSSSSSITCSSYFQSFDNLDAYWNLSGSLSSFNIPMNQKVKRALYCNLNPNLHSEMTSIMSKSRVFFHLPAKFFQQENTISDRIDRRSLKIQFLVFRNSNLFGIKSILMNQTDHESEYTISSIIVGCSVPRFPLIKIFQPIEISIKVTFFSLDVLPVWWNPSTHKWSSKECKLKEVNEQLKLVRFECFRFGYYAVMINRKSIELLQVQPMNRNQIWITICEILTYFAPLAALTILLLLSVTFILTFSSLQIDSIIKHFLVNFWILNIILILGFVWKNFDSSESSCLIFSSLFEVVVIPSLLWFIITAINIYSNQRQKMYVKKDGFNLFSTHSMSIHGYYLFVYSLTCIVFGIYLIINFSSINVKKCHLGLKYNFIKTHGPLALLASLTLLTYIIIACLSFFQSSSSVLSNHSLNIDQASNDASSEQMFSKKFYSQLIFCLIFFFEWTCISFEIIWRPNFFETQLLISDDHIYQFCSNISFLFLTLYSFLYVFWMRKDVLNSLKICKLDFNNSSNPFDVIRNDQELNENKLKISKIKKDDCSHLFYEEINPTSVKLKSRSSLNIHDDYEEELIQIDPSSELFNSPRLNELARKFFEKSRRKRVMEANNLNANKNTIDLSFKNMIYTTCPTTRPKAKSEIVGLSAYYKNNFQNRPHYPLCKPAYFCESDLTLTGWKSRDLESSQRRLKTIRNDSPFLHNHAKTLFLKSSPSIPIQVNDANKMDPLVCRLPSVIHACSCLSKKTTPAPRRNRFPIKRSPRSKCNRHSYLATYNDVGQEGSSVEVKSDPIVRRKAKLKHRSFRSKKSSQLYQSECKHFFEPQYNSSCYRCHHNNGTSSESE